MSKEFDAFRDRILDRQHIDSVDVEELAQMLQARGELQKSDIDLLFTLKNNIPSSAICPEFARFFIDTTTSFLLEDEASPGELDAEEAKWLRAKLQISGANDRLDIKLLNNLKQKSINFPEILITKSKPVRFFEAGLFSFRFMTVLAVIGSICASIVLFVSSTLHIFHSIKEFVHSMMNGEEYDSKLLVAHFVSTIDGYLFAMILLIFGMGIYELFIFKMDPINKALDSRPTWLQIHSIDDLKTSLAKVILMILIVSFFESSLQIEFNDVLSLVYLGVGILLISGALLLTHFKGDGKH